MNTIKKRIEKKDDILILDFSEDKNDIHFKNCLYWFEKCSNYLYIPTIIEYSYVDKIIKCQLKKNIKYNKYANQIREINLNLKDEDCILKDLTMDDIWIYNKKINIINMEKCLNIRDINKEDKYNYSNLYLLKTILDKNHIFFLNENCYIVLFIENLNILKKYLNQINLILNEIDLIVFNNNNLNKDVKNEILYNEEYKTEIDNLRNSNINILLDNATNIFSSKKIIDFIKNKDINSDYIININLNFDDNFLDIQEFFNKHNISKIIKNNKIINWGLYYKNSDFVNLGIYGNVDFLLEIKQICFENNINFSKYIENDDELLNWYKLTKLYENEMIKENKSVENNNDNNDNNQNDNNENDNNENETIHKDEYSNNIYSFNEIEIIKFVLKGDLNDKLKLINKDKMEYIPKKIINNNFIISFDIYKDLLKNLIINDNYNDISYEHFLFFLIFYNSKKYYIDNDLI